jgi:tetratricopeptide (TPR) repeat protein
MPDKTTRRGCLDPVAAAWARSVGLVAALLLFSGCGLFITPQHRIAVARREIQAGKWQEAAAELRTVIQRDGQNAEAWQLLAELSLDAADFAGAQSALTHALAAGARGADVDALRVRTWLAVGQPRAALDAIGRHAVALAEPLRSVELARAHLALRQPDEALQILRPLSAQHPALTDARVVMAEALADEGQLAQALGELDAAAQRDPTSPLPALLRGGILASRGQYAAAEASLTLALQRMPPAQPAPDRVRALVLLTDVRLAQDETQPAAASQATLARLTPNAPVTELLGARVQMARGDVRGAIDQLQGILAQAPGYVIARLYLGAAELARGDRQQAQDQLEQVVQAAPDNLEARKLLATVRLDLGQPQAALSALKPALGTPAADPQLLVIAGGAQAALGETTAAVASYEQAQQIRPTALVATELYRLRLATHSPSPEKPLEDWLAREPRDWRVREVLADYFLGLRSWQAATGELEAALQQAPQSVLALNNLAWAYDKLGDARAQSLAERAHQIAPQSAEVDDTLGWILAQRHEAGRAVPLLAQAVKHSPEDSEVEYHYAYALVAAGERDEAQRILTRILSTSRPFDSRAAAQRLLASVKAT